MNVKALQAVLDSQNIIYSDDNYDQAYHIRSINFNTHGNLYVDPLSTFMKFDLANGLIYVKEYYWQPISSRFSDYTIDGNRLITGLKPAVFHRKYTFRRPKVGDVVFFVSKKDNRRADIVAEITSIQALNGEVIFTVDKGLTDIIESNYFACYADGEHFDVVGTDDLITEYENDATLLFWHRPKTGFKTDMYISINNIASISVC